MDRSTNNSGGAPEGQAILNYNTVVNQLDIPLSAADTQGLPCQTASREVVARAFRFLKCCENFNYLQGQAECQFNFPTIPSLQ